MKTVEHKRVPEPRDEPEVGDEGICRTCVKPIFFEETDRGPGFLPRTTWSDRHRVDAVVCFSSINYGHEPLRGRELAIWNAAVRYGLSTQVADPTEQSIEEIAADPNAYVQKTRELRRGGRR